MNSLPQPIPSLIFASLGVSVAGSVFALTGISLGVSPLLWVIPASFAATFPYHITTLTLARVEPHGSSRLFSAFKIIYGFIIATSWTLSTCVAITAIVLQTKGVFPKYEMHVGIWIMYTCIILTLVEGLLAWGIAIFSRRERKRITYAEKWRPLATDLAWRFVRTPYMTQILTLLTCLFSSINRT